MNRLMALSAALVLTACGGGGGDTATSAATPAATTAASSAEGFWNGTSSTGERINLAVLENGETWGLTSTSAGALTGALYGTVTASGSTVTGSGTSFSFITRTNSSGALSGTVATKATITLAASTGGKFNGTYSASYDQTPALGSLADTYNGFAVTGNTAAQTVAVTIDVNGNVSSSFVSGNLICNASGKATPRASGKNVFDLQLTFTGNFCALGNVTTQGVATYGATSRQLIALALNGAKSDGFVFLGTR